MIPQTKKRRCKKAERQIIAFIMCVLLVGALLGGGVVAAVNAFNNNSTVAAQYGEGSGAAFNYELEGSFEPLECDLPVELQEFTYYLCKAYCLDFDFAMAVMYTESNFNPDAISNTNDSGLMQINACNYAELSSTLGITDFAEPYQNIRAGLYILRRLFEKYNEPSMVCMAYNMGEYGASVLWDNGVYATDYSQKVIAKTSEYKSREK
jgi:soluble lytic murein transglycosylase-like protein